MKIIAKKPRICFALPGIHYTAHSPYIRSTLPMLPYLAEDFEITLVYRKMLDPQPYDHPEHRYLTILDPTQLSSKEQQSTQEYFALPNYIAFWKYRQTIAQFAQKHATDFDLIFEKEWAWLGMFAQAFHPYQIPTLILIEAFYKYQKIQQAGWLKQLTSIGIQPFRLALRKHWSQAVDSIVVETRQMQKMLQAHGQVTPQQPIFPIPYGVDSEIFKVRDRNQCRQQLGIKVDDLVLTYVGSLNRFIQEPGAMIEALGRERPANVVLYMVGDGRKQSELEDLARQYQAPVVFTGRQPQSVAALYIGAANLCVAPYNKYLYLDDQFTCASLKIPEYLSCGRLVLSIRCERMDDLLDHERYGFVVDNRVESYCQFFRNLPRQTYLSQMEQTLLHDLNAGILKSKEILFRWWEIADMYKEAIERTLAGKRKISPGKHVSRVANF